MYVTAAAAGSTGSYPSLQRVFAFYAGHPVGFQPTLGRRQHAARCSTAPRQARARPGVSLDLGMPVRVNQQVIAALKQAQQFYVQAQAALHNGDLATYGQDIAKMEQQITNAQADSKAGQAPKTSPKPGSVPTPTPTASG